MALKSRATRQPSRKPGRDRYEQILDAAGRLIVSENSLEGLTLQSVAHEAGVPRVFLTVSLFGAVHRESQPKDWPIHSRRVSESSRDCIECSSCEGVRVGGRYRGHNLAQIIYQVWQDHSQL